MAATYFTSTKRDDRLAQLWQELLADPVPLQPAAEMRRPLGEPVGVGQHEPVSLMAAADARPVSRGWRVDLAKLFHSLLEPEVAEPPFPSAVGAISEAEAFPEMSIEAAHEASLSYSTPFRWEPKPDWINPPARPVPPFSSTTDVRRFAPWPKIPLRPLHKQPFYKRFFFYLHRWLSRQK
jgi:hypothetical protein